MNSTTIKSQVKQSDFQTTIDSVDTDLYYLQNINGLEISVTNFGARIVEVWTPDRNGNFDDIVLGHSTIDEYINFRGERFLGAAIGRYGNRIANGRFTLDGQEYTLACNNGKNSLHGGINGFDMVTWKVKHHNNQNITFTYLSKDGEEGFPGNLNIEMSYTLNDNNTLDIKYCATTDKKTVVNLTHHSFFNLRGECAGTINDHLLRINADSFTPTTDELIPTGEISPVAGTPMDFKVETAIGARINDDFEPLKMGKGYDHNWVLNRSTDTESEFAASVYEPQTGRYIEVWTTEPAIQFYGGNFFDGSTMGKHGNAYQLRTSFALETQHYPDSPNYPHFPSTVLSPNETYHHTCTYKFGVRQETL